MIMLTEYSSYDDIRKFRDKARAKLYKMCNGWLGKEVRKERLKWRSIKDFNNFKEISFSRQFKMDEQMVEVNFSPNYNTWGNTIKNDVACCLSTNIETNKGKSTIILGETEIHILTPHYRKRFKERLGSVYFYQDSDEIPYTRNGRCYALICRGDSVHITKRIESDIIKHITILHRDMCTSKNYQELFERAGKAIDEQDVYEWK